jgi:hypothetical protein
MTVYNLEYGITDVKGRTKQMLHWGITTSIEGIEQAKRTLIEAHGNNLKFAIYTIESFFP